MSAEEIEVMIHEKYPQLNQREIKAILLGGSLMSCFGNENQTDEEMQNFYDYMLLADGYVNDQYEEVKIVQIALDMMTKLRSK